MSYLCVSCRQKHEGCGRVAPLRSFGALSEKLCLPESSTEDIMMARKKTKEGGCDRNHESQITDHRLPQSSTTSAEERHERSRACQGVPGRTGHPKSTITLGLPWKPRSLRCLPDEDGH